MKDAIVGIEKAAGATLSDDSDDDSDRFDPESEQGKERAIRKALAKGVDRHHAEMQLAKTK